MTERGQNARQWAEDRASRLGAWGWFAIVALAALLVGAIYYCVYAWQDVPNVGIPPIGWLFLVLGVILTVVVGGGLMLLLFYSSRKGRDF